MDLTAEEQADLYALTPEVTQKVLTRAQQQLTTHFQSIQKEHLVEQLMRA
jgi:hypothetical protein